MSPPPNLFLVGGPKCGTTALTRYLGAQPGVFAPDTADQHPFGSDLDFRHGPRTPQADWQARYAGAASAPWRLDSSVWHLYSTRAAAEIRAFNPEARVLIALRDPVEALYAHWGQLRYNAHGHEDIVDISAALAAESDRAAGRRIPAGMPLPSALLYRQVVAWAAQVARYQRAFPAEQIHILLLEDLKAAPRQTWAELVGWLGLDPGAPVDLRPVNAAKAVRSEGLRRLLRAVPAGWKDALPRPIRVGVRRRLRRLNTVRRPRPPLDPALRRQLQEELRPDVIRLEELLDRPLLAPAGPWFGP